MFCYYCGRLLLFSLYPYVVSWTRALYVSMSYQRLLAGVITSQPRRQQFKGSYKRSTRTGLRCPIMSHSLRQVWLFVPKCWRAHGIQWARANSCDCQLLPEGNGQQRRPWLSFRQAFCVDRWWQHSHPSGGRISNSVQPSAAATTTKASGRSR